MTTAHNPRAEMPEDAPVIAPEDGQKYGYWGQAPDTRDDREYTVAGVVEQAEKDAKADEKPELKAASSRAATKKESDK